MANVHTLRIKYNNAILDSQLAISQDAYDYITAALEQIFSTHYQFTVTLITTLLWQLQ